MSRQSSRRTPRKKKLLRPIPTFANEDQERKFWATHDSVDYIDWSKAMQPTFPKLRPTTTAISLRLPVSMLEELKSLANQRDVPYQSLMKVFLADSIERQRLRRRKAG